MKKIAIVRYSSPLGEISYHAVAGTKQAQGITAGQALDALSAQFPPGERSTLLVVQIPMPSQFLSEDQQNRLIALMARWRSAQDQGQVFSPDEERELESLIDLELRASAVRAVALADSAGQ